MSNKQFFFKIPRSDFTVQTFRCGGKGGQNVNKVETGVRIKHNPSGAVTTCTVHRTQLQNKREALKKLAELKEFKLWLRLECARRRGVISPEEAVERWMAPENIRTDVKNDEGLWTELPTDVIIEEAEEGK